MITRGQLRAWGACYSDERIAELVPEEGLTPLQVCDLDIPAEDRLWVLLRPEVLSGAFGVVLATITERAERAVDDRTHVTETLVAALRGGPDVAAAARATAATAAVRAARAAGAETAWAARAAAWDAAAEAERSAQLDDVRRALLGGQT